MYKTRCSERRYMSQPVLVRPSHVTGKPGILQAPRPVAAVDPVFWRSSGFAPHPEQGSTPGPAVDHREPAGVGAEQGVELHVGAGPEPAEQDVGDPLALEVGALLGRRRPGLGPAAIRVEVE